MAMVPHGEVGPIFAELGRFTGILGQNLNEALGAGDRRHCAAAGFGLRWLYRQPARINLARRHSAF